MVSRADRMYWIIWEVKDFLIYEATNSAWRLFVYSFYVQEGMEFGVFLFGTSYFFWTPAC